MNDENKRFIVILYKNGNFDTVKESKAIKKIKKHKSDIYLILVPIYNKAMITYIAIEPEDFREDFIYAQINQDIISLQIIPDAIIDYPLKKDTDIITNVFDMYRKIRIYDRMSYAEELVNGYIEREYYNGIEFKNFNINIQFEGKPVRHLNFQTDFSVDRSTDLTTLIGTSLKIYNSLSTIFKCVNRRVDLFFNLECKKWDTKKINSYNLYRFKNIKVVDEHTFLLEKDYIKLEKLFELPIYITFNFYITEIENNKKALLKTLIENRLTERELENNFIIFTLLESRVYLSSDLVSTIILFEFSLAYLSLCFGYEISSDNIIKIMPYLHFSEITDIIGPIERNVEVSQIRKNPILAFDQNKKSLINLRDKWYVDNSPYLALSSDDLKNIFTDFYKDILNSLI